MTLQTSLCHLATNIASCACVPNAHCMVLIGSRTEKFVNGMNVLRNQLYMTFPQLHNGLYIICITENKWTPHISARFLVLL